MVLNNVIDVLTKLKDCMKEHGKDFQNNETHTRMALVDPLLQALEWDTTNPKLVRPEQSVKRQRVDYALLNTNKEPIVFLEAKALGKTIGENEITQLMNYIMERNRQEGGILYGVLTNGDKWIVYDPVVMIGPRPDDGCILSVSIAKDALVPCALELLWFWNCNWKPALNSGLPVRAKQPFLLDRSNDLKPQLEPDPDRHVTDESQPELIPPSGSWIPISEFSPKPRSPKPKQIKFPNGETYELGSWKNVLVQTANWLISHKHLTEESVPVKSSSRRYIVCINPKHPNVETLHPNEKTFFDPRKIHDIYIIETHVSARASVQNAKTLMDRCNQALDQTYLQLAP